MLSYTLTTSSTAGYLWVYPRITMMRRKIRRMIGYPPGLHARYA